MNPFERSAPHTHGHRVLPVRERAEQLGGSLPPLLVHAERVAATVAQGVHGRRRVGQGETFWQYREYQPGDPTPRIDWRRSAKSDRVFVRETEWEAAQSVWFWRDASPSMAWRSVETVPTKRERAELLVLSLMVLLIRAGEHVSLLGSGLTPRAGQGTLGRMAMLLEQEAEGPDSLPPNAPVPRHGQVILLSDFLTPLDSLAPRLHALAERGVHGALVQVLDPAEEDLPYDGRVRFEGVEGEGEWLLSRVADVRGSYRDRLAAHTDALHATARRTGAHLLRHRTDRPPETALLAIYNALSAHTGP